MNTQSKLNSQQYLSSISNDNSSLQTRIAATLFCHKYSKMFEITLLVIEYLQLIAQAILLVPGRPQDTYYDENPVFRFIVYIARLFDLGNWLYSEEYEVFSFVILVLSGVLTICKYLFYLYICLFVSKRIKGWPPLLGVWRLLFKAQTRVLCFFMTSIWVRALLVTIENDVGILQIGKNTMIALAVIMIVLEYIFSLFLHGYYSFVLPSKSFLASRDNHLESTTLTQKLLVEILQLILPGDMVGYYWVFTTVNLFFSLIREFSFFTRLPLYNFSALILQDKLLMLVLSLNIACFIGNVLDTLDYKNTWSFIIMTWIIGALLAIKLSTGYLKALQIDLLSTRKRDTENLFIYKIHALLNFLSYTRKPTKYMKKYSFSFLMNSSASTNIESILDINSDGNTDYELDLTSKEFQTKVICQYLEQLCLKYPKNDLIKLYAAHFYVTKSQMLQVAMKMINDLQKSRSHKISLNASLLRYEMEARIKKGYRECSRQIDIYKYLSNKSHVAHLEQLILSQIEIQQKLYQEVLSNAPDLAKIFADCQRIHEMRQAIEADIKALIGKIPDYYIRPLTVCALYHSLLTFSVDDYLYYQKRYTQVSKKYEKFYKSDRLCLENIYQDSNFLMLFSGQKHECGKISFVTRPIEKAYGREAQSYFGKDGKGITPPRIQDEFLQFFRSFDLRGPESFPDAISRFYGYHRDGFIVPIDIYFFLHPYTAQGLFINSLIRPDPTKKEVILILDNGDIEGATPKIAKRLGLLRPQRQGVPSTKNVREISQYLKDINDSFNVITASTQCEPNKDKVCDYETAMDLQTAENLHSIYSNEGKVITFSSNLKKDYSANTYETTYSYHCTVKSIAIVTLPLKQVTLEEVDGYSQESDESSRDPTEKLLAKVQVEDISFSKSGNPSKIQDMESGIVELEDEKENGWIDFSSLASPELQKGLSSTIQPDAQEYNMTSPFIQEGLLTTSRAPLVTEHKPSNFHKSFNLKSNLAKPREEKEDQSRNTETKKVEKLFYQEPSIASVTSKNTKHQKISRAFKSALEKRHYPISFKVITVIFYLLFIAIFTTQLVFKLSLDKAIQNLSVGKDILNLAAQRSFYLSNVHIFARMSWDVAVQRVLPSYYGIYSSVPLTAIPSLRNSAIQLGQVNRDFFSKTDQLYEGIQQSLFAKDVKLNDSDTNSISYATNFQTIESLVETALRMANLMSKNDTTQAKKYFNFLLQNALNDIYIKNTNIVSSLRSFFADERNGIYHSIIIAIIITSILSGGIILVLMIITWHRYSEEKQNMSAVTRISNQGMQTALNKIKALKAAIENESPFDDYRQNTEFLEITKKKLGGLAVDSAKKEHDKTLITNGISRRYVLYIGRVWVFTLLIAGIAVTNCLVGKTSLDFFNKKIDQLNLLGSIKSGVSVAAALHHELYGNNGTTFIINSLTPAAMQRMTVFLEGRKNVLASTFMKDDFTYDPTISKILFSNACPVITGSWKSICNQQRVQENKGNLVYLLTDYTNLMRQQTEMFALSNKTFEALVTLEMQDTVNYVTEFALLTRICDGLSNIVDQEFESEMSSTNQERQSIFIFLLLALIILSVLVWIYVLRRLIDYTQQFKIVLSVFPPDLILSNFVLKSFLMKTSKGALGSIKNHI